MPRNTQKLKELQEIINSQKLEIAGYKQLISSIDGLIRINAKKPIILLDEYERGNEQQEAINRTIKKTFQKKTDIKGDWEEEKLTERGEIPQPIPQPEQGAASRNLQQIKRSHVDELKEELGKQAGEGEEYPKPSKIKKAREKIPTNINEVIEQEKARKEAEERGEKPKKVSIDDLPPEARALYESNKARARAAEREKNHGEEGDREYNRLQEKEAIEKGEKPIEGKDCPHCGEVLEAPIIRGYHDIC
jgi:hypothetical protein